MDTQQRRARSYAGWAIVLLVIAAAAASVLQPATAQEEQGVTAAADPFAYAASSYANQCAQCHGSDGSGGTVPGTDGRAPAIDGDSDVTAAYLDLVLRTGRMPPAGNPFDNRARRVFYDDAQREAVVAYLTETFGLEGDIPEVEEGDVARGLEVFSLNCAHCHGNTGAGGNAGQGAWTPEVTGLDGTAVAEAIRVGPFEMPAFGEDVLTDQEVDDVVAYLEAVEEEEGTPVLGFVELNPVFASGMVGLLAVVMLGSLLYIGSRPAPFESVGEPPRELAAPVPSSRIGMTAARVEPVGDDDDGPVPTEELDARRRARGEPVPGEGDRPQAGADAEAVASEGTVGPVEDEDDGAVRPTPTDDDGPEEQR